MHDPESLLSVRSAASRLPLPLRRQFRIVSMAPADSRVSVEIFLQSRGFRNASTLARKVDLLFDMCRVMFGTVTPVTNGSGNVGEVHSTFAQSITTHLHTLILLHGCNIVSISK